VRLRVLTLNVQNDEGDPRRTGLINRELRHLDPDLVALQEVRYPGQLAALVHGTALAHTTHQAEVLDPEPPEARRYGGGALATRWPHTVVAVEEGRSDPDFHWWTLAVTVRDVLFVTPTTHWQPEAAAARARQAEGIARIDAAHPGPVVIAGDLNDNPDAVPLIGGGYRDAWAEAGDGPGHTWPAHRRRIDYVLARGMRVVRVELVGDHPVGGVWLSDHRGVVADLEV
jgi:endonuclease/exonuclease/phosphatase family metal-dependent hydrolase